MLNRLKITLVLIPLAILLAVGIYVYSLWAEEKRRTADIPVEAASTMLRDLRRFHEKRGRFPQHLRQMEGIVWEKKEERSYSLNNRGLSHRNYFYLYTRLSPHRFTLWAVPVGQVREESPTWFLMVTPETGRRWKGGALSLDDAKKIAVSPSIAELVILGLTEQPKIDFPRK